MGLRKNLTVEEIEEWSNLSSILFPQVAKRYDIWKWALDEKKNNNIEKGTYLAETLSHKLALSGNQPHQDFYLHLWNGSSPKMVKIFIWELFHGSICTADILLVKALWLVSFPSWCFLLPKQRRTPGAFHHLMPVCLVILDNHPCSFKLPYCFPIRCDYFR